MTFRCQKGIGIEDLKLESNGDWKHHVFRATTIGRGRNRIRYEHDNELYPNEKIIF